MMRRGFTVGLAHSCPGRADPGEKLDRKSVGHEMFTQISRTLFDSPAIEGDRK